MRYDWQICHHVRKFISKVFLTLFVWLFCLPVVPSTKRLQVWFLDLGVWFQSCSGRFREATHGCLSCTWMFLSISAFLCKFNFLKKNFKNIFKTRYFPAPWGPRQLPCQEKASVCMSLSESSAEGLSHPVVICNDDCWLISATKLWAFYSTTETSCKRKEFLRLRCSVIKT